MAEIEKFDPKVLESIAEKLTLDLARLQRRNLRETPEAHTVRAALDVIVARLGFSHRRLLDCLARDLDPYRPLEPTRDPVTMESLRRCREDRDWRNLRALLALEIPELPPTARLYFRAQAWYGLGFPDAGNHFLAVAFTQDLSGMTLVPSNPV